MRSRFNCMPHICVRKEKSSHFRYPLAGTIHIDCYLGKGPRVGKGRQAMQELRCEFWRYISSLLDRDFSVSRDNCFLLLPIVISHSLEVQRLRATTVS